METLFLLAVVMMVLVGIGGEEIGKGAEESCKERSKKDEEGGETQGSCQ